MRVWVRVASRILLAGAVVVGLAAILFGVRLASGPIELDEFAPTIEERINAELSGWRVKLGGADLAYDRQAGDIGVRLRRVKLYDPAGALAATAPSATVKASIGAALRGRVALTEARLDGVAGVMTRQPDGRYRFAFEAEAATEWRPPPQGAPPSKSSPDGAGAISRIVEGLAGDRDALPMLDRFRRIEIHAARLRYEDRLGDVEWISEDAAVVVRRTETGLEADVAVSARPEAAPAGDPALSLTVVAKRGRGEDQVALSASFANLAGSAVAAQIPALEMASKLDGLLSGSAEAALRLSDGELTALTANAQTQAAEVALGSGLAPLPVERVSADLAYLPAEDKMRLTELRFNIGGISGVAAGEVEIKRDPDGKAVAADGVLSAAEVRIARKDFYDQPTTIDTAAVHFRIETDPLLLRVTSAEIVHPELTARGSVEARVSPDGKSSGTVQAWLTSFPADRLAALWPRAVATDPRAWVEENVFAGTIETATLDYSWDDAKSAAGEPPVVDFRFRFSDLGAHYVKPMTPLTKGDGAGRVQADRFDVSLDSGTVDLGEVGALDVSGSAFAIPSLSVDVERGDVDLKAKGPARAVLALIDQEPMGFPSAFGLKVSTVRGAADLTAQVSLPLLKDLALADVQVSVDARLTRLALLAPKLNEPVSAARARIRADTKKLDFESPSVLFRDAPLSLRWTETFSPARGQPRTRMNLAGRLSADRLRALGAPEALKLSGRADLTGVLIAADGAAPRLDLKIDARPLAAALPRIGFRKAAGAPGSGGVRLLFGDGRTDLKNLDLRLGDLRVVGAVGLGKAGAFRRADLSTLAIGAHTRLGGVVERVGAGFRARLKGARVDLAPLIDGAGEASDVGDPLAIDLKLSADLARIDAKRTLRAFEATVVQSKSGTALDVSARSKGGAPATLSYRDGPTGGQASLRSDDAGRLLKDLDLTDSAGGGTLRVSAKTDAPPATPNGPPRTWTGTVKFNDVTLIDPPILAKILSNGLLLGLVDGGGTDGIRFDRVRAPFTFDGRVARIKEAAATGPSMGVTADGVINRAEKTLSLTGSVSPFYAVNRLLGRVPILGDLLVGGSGEGIVGVAYSVAGPLADPKVVVQPLSALAPGRLRGLFEGETEERRFDPAIER